MAQSNPWFRLYNEIIDDKKIRLLAFEDRWHFVALLCMKNSGDLDRKKSLLDQIVSVGLGVHGADLVSIKKRLTEVGLIDSNWQPLAWNVRQFKSDASTERVKKHREKKKAQLGNTNETGMKRFRNAPETEAEEETEKEQEEKRSATPPELLLPEWLNRSLWREWVKTRQTGKTRLTAHAKKLALAKLEEICPGGAGHEAVINKTIESGWKTFYPLGGDDRRSGPHSSVPTPPPRTQRTML